MGDFRDYNSYSYSLQKTGMAPGGHMHFYNPSNLWMNKPSMTSSSPSSVIMSSTYGGRDAVSEMGTYHSWQPYRDETTAGLQNTNANSVSWLQRTASSAKQAFSNFPSAFNKDRKPDLGRYNRWQPNNDVDLNPGFQFLSLPAKPVSVFQAQQPGITTTSGYRHFSADDLNDNDNEWTNTISLMDENVAPPSVAVQHIITKPGIKPPNEIARAMNVYVPTPRQAVQTEQVIPDSRLPRTDASFLHPEVSRNRANVDSQLEKNIQGSRFQQVETPLSVPDVSRNRSNFNSPVTQDSRFPQTDMSTSKPDLVKNRSNFESQLEKAIQDSRLPQNDRSFSGPEVLRNSSNYESQLGQIIQDSRPQQSDQLPSRPPAALIQSPANLKKQLPVPAEQVIPRVPVSSKDTSFTRPVVSKEMVSEVNNNFANNNNNGVRNMPAGGAFSRKLDNVGHVSRGPQLPSMSEENGSADDLDELYGKVNPTTKAKGQGQPDLNFNSKAGSQQPMNLNNSALTSSQADDAPPSNVRSGRRQHPTEGPRLLRQVLRNNNNNNQPPVRQPAVIQMPPAIQRPAVIPATIQKPAVSDESRIVKDAFSFLDDFDY